ncbi:MAG: hypothetical protein K2W95_28665 [Candidatus Obscuribacterales bacterium]|nr:hypothetical protein [Candidatus Obscuribacterales bacterium]
MASNQNEQNLGNKDVLDENYLAVIGNMLRMAQELPEEQRRVEVLKMFNLPPETTEAEAEAAFRSEINDSFEQPIDQTLVERLLQMILAALRHPAAHPAT